MPNPGGDQVPRWLRIALVIGAVPIVVGFVVILYREGVSGPVLVGGIIGPAVAMLWHRHRPR